ncbi:MAG: citrate lyase holo-[acyl-carrier protein] synthase [Clostridia bacterium]|nr:citrate lyase holo-[acyl-carrier protein] synthase [Clostridia bacterium]
MREVSLGEMLAAREKRAARQQKMLAEFDRPLISFAMNIAGPVKDSPLIRRSFSYGLTELEQALRGAGLRPVRRLFRRAVTGPEALFVVRGEAKELKRLCLQVEEAKPLGRLFDLDVLDEKGVKMDRADFGKEERGCIVCGAVGRGCASRRLHSLAELQEAQEHLMREHFDELDGDQIAARASEALRQEVMTTPKPGLVDQNNTGSHRDMDLGTFTRSIAVLHPFWKRFFLIGRETAGLSPAETFRELKPAGVEAETAMRQATGGVNTHKGAIFTLGVICGALGRIWPIACEHPAWDECPVQKERPAQEEKPVRTWEQPTSWEQMAAEHINRLLTECREMVRDAAAIDFEILRALKEKATENPAVAAAVTPLSHGETTYLRFGLTGARGEAAAGFPALTETALPILREGLAKGKSLNDAAAVALIHLIARGEDTNLITRGGREGAAWATEAARYLIRQNPFPSIETIVALDRAFCDLNLSPGGCADLLALALFLREF